MKLYCMCQITGNVPPHSIDVKGFGPSGNQVFLAPNRFLPIEDVRGEPWRAVMLEKSMKVEKIGIHQKVCTAGEAPANPWAKTEEEEEEDEKQLAMNRRHYPDVDLYKCRHCGAIIIVE